MAKKVDKWLQGDSKNEPAIRHKGALTKAAKENGRTTLEEAKVEAKSPRKSIRSRGALGLRLMGRAKHGNIGKAKAKKGTRKYTSRKKVA